MTKWLIATLSLWLFSSYAAANVFHDSNLDWKTIETKHFYIHYHNGAEQIARDLIPIANKIHDDVTTYLSWVPQDKTHVVLTDEYDISNGWATVFPRNNTHIFISAPDEINSLEDHNGWLELVFLHEYIHIVHLDKAHGAPLAIRKVMGREGLFFPTVFPNAFQPGWFIEGIATYGETSRKQGIGRGQSTYYNMLMRGEVMDGVKELRRINQPIGSWPAGTIRYLYGVNYHNFIRDRYSDKKIRTMVEGMSDNFVPYRIGSNTYNTFGKDLDGMWSEFNKYLREKHEPVIARVKQQGVIEGEQLSDEGYIAESLRALDDQAFYVAFSGSSHPALMRSVAGKPAEKLRDVNFGARLDVHRQKGILITQPERCRNARVYYDIYRVDIDGGDYTRLTDCARYRHAVWSNKGDRIIAVHNELGVNSLHILDDKARLMEKVWLGSEGEQISQMSYSPTEDKIIASIWRKNMGWNLELFDMASRQWSFVTRDSSIQSQPVFSEDGQSIIYTSDNDGIYNVYRLNLASKKVSRLTNVLGGAFSPGLTSNGLYYLGYQSQGYYLYHVTSPSQIDYAQLQLASVEQISAPFVNIEPTQFDRKESELPGEEYSPWQSVGPTWWLPYFLIDDQRSEIGFQTFGNDALYRHSYSLFMAFDVENEWLTGSFDYFYDGLWPIIHLGLSRTTDIFLDSNDDTSYIRANKKALLETIVPFTSLDSSLFLHAAVFTEREDDAWVAPGLPDLPDTREDFAGLALRYISAKKYPLSVSRSEGRELRLVYEDTDLIGNTDPNLQGQILLGEWREFIHLGKEHVLALRLTEGRGENNSRPFRLGGIQSDNVFVFGVGSVAPVFDERDYPLRGYDEGRSELIGQNMRLFTAEYRFPLWRIEHGWMSPPFGFNQIHGTLFYDVGGVWAETESKPAEYYDGVGAELNTDLDLLYDFRLNVVLGFAHGLDDTIGKDKVYLRIGSQF
jgi:hypothetical protein